MSEHVLVARQDPPPNGGNGGDGNNNEGNNGGNNGGNAGNGGNNGGNTDNGNNGGNAGNGNNGNNGGDAGNGNNGGNQQNGGNQNGGNQNGGNQNGGNQGGNQNGGNNNAGSGSNQPTPSNGTSSVSIPQTAALGGITMLEPSSKMGTSSYYPIAPSQYITFKWNVTSVYVRPTSLTVVAYCEQNKNTYQVGPTAGTSNTIPGNQSSIVWNPYEWSTRPGQPPFAMASYTLKIWDERGENSKQVGGYLAPYSKTVFGMYLPRAYTPLSEWKCATCSGAMTAISQPAGLSVLTSLLIILITAYGLLRRH